VWLCGRRMARLVTQQQSQKLFIETVKFICVSVVSCYCCCYRSATSIALLLALFLCYFCCCCYRSAASGLLLQISLCCTATILLCCYRSVAQLRLLLLLLLLLCFCCRFCYFCFFCYVNVSSSPPMHGWAAAGRQGSVCGGRRASSTSKKRRHAKICSGRFVGTFSRRGDHWSCPLCCGRVCGYHLAQCRENQAV
jgi:hypothetical protein